MCKAMEDMRDQVLMNERMDVAGRMLEKGVMSLEDIADIAKLPLEVVQALANKKVGWVRKSREHTAQGMVDASALSDAEMDAELEWGYADMKAGRTKSAKSTFADIRKDYGL